MDLSFIIVNYNTTALTSACIKSIYDFTRKNTFEVILIDNASTDRSIENITTQYAGLIFISNKVNVGFGRANNQGIELAKGRYIFLLNSDAQLISDAANAFFAYMESDQNNLVGCCGAELVRVNGNKQISYGNFPSISEAIAMLGFSKFFKRYFETHLSSGTISHSDLIRPVDFLCGADMFIRKSILDKVGSFDPDFFLYFEEVELSKRMKNAGYQSVICPKVKIIHHESASSTNDEPNLQKITYLAQSRRIYFRKCHGRISAMLVNKIFGIQALIFFCIKLKRRYLRAAYILFSN